MNKICTSLEQSQKLMELGIDINTADMYWEERINLPKVVVGNYALHIHCRATDKDYKKLTNPVLSPAWSLSALLAVLPSVITRNDKPMLLTLEKADAYNLYYKSPNRLNELWETKEEPIDACVEMIVNLKEMDLI